MLTDDEALAIYNAVCRHGGVTTRDVADALAMPFDTVRVELERQSNPITDTHTKRGGMRLPSLIVFRDGGWYQNHQSPYSHKAAEPGKIVVIRRGHEGGRVNKKNARKWVRR